MMKASCLNDGGDDDGDDDDDDDQLKAQAHHADRLAGDVEDIFVVAFVTTTIVVTIIWELAGDDEGVAGRSSPRRRHRLRAGRRR